MNWPALGKQSVVRTTILDDNTAAKEAIQHWTGKTEGKVSVWVAIWRTDGLCSDDCPVGAATVPKYRNEWWSRCSYPSTGNVALFDAVRWAIRHLLDVMIGKQGTVQYHRVDTGELFADPKAAI
jgi:hypothetical protein